MKAGGGWGLGVGGGWRAVQSQGAPGSLPLAAHGREQRLTSILATSHNEPESVIRLLNSLKLLSILDRHLRHHNSKIFLSYFFEVKRRN